MTASVNSQYNDAHRLFLQVIMQEGLMNAENVKNCYKKILVSAQLPDDPVYTRLGEFISAINDRIEPLKMKIAKNYCEHSGSANYVFVILPNEEEDLERQKQLESGEQKSIKLYRNPNYTEDELIFFKKLIELVIASSPTGSITALEAYSTINVGSWGNIKKEKFLEKITFDKWITSKHGIIRLTARTTAELKDYIIENFEDVKKCSICSQICIRYMECPKDTCDSQAHTHCLNIKRKRAKGGPISCPVCCSAWE